jgi:hypothetical protein
VSYENNPTKPWQNTLKSRRATPSLWPWVLQRPPPANLPQWIQKNIQARWIIGDRESKQINMISYLLLCYDMLNAGYN